VDSYVLRVKKSTFAKEASGDLSFYFAAFGLPARGVVAAVTSLFSLQVASIARSLLISHSHD